MLVLLGLLCLGGAWAGNFDNAIGDDPEIMKCSADSIIVRFDFQNAFNGELFTLDKDEQGKKTCRKTSEDGDFTVGDEIVVTFDNSTCPFAKDHVDIPGCTETDGGPAKECSKTAYKITVYLRFWPADSHEVGVHTKIDRAYTFACTPIDSTNPHDAALQVIDVTPQTIIEPFTINPSCSYCISDIHPLGTPDPTPDPSTCLALDAALPFDRKVYHEVHCEPNVHWAGAYCLEVVSIKASFLETNDTSELNNKNSILITSEDCTQDDKLISDFTYSENTWGYATSHPFHVGHPNGNDDDVSVFFYAVIRYFPSSKTDECVSQGQGCQSGGRRKRSLAPPGSTQALVQKKRYKRGNLPKMVLQL